MYSMALDNSWLVMNEDEMYDVNGGGSTQLFYIDYNSLVQMVGAVLDLGALAVSAAFIAATSYLALVPVVNAAYFAIIGMSALYIGTMCMAAISQGKGLGFYYYYEKILFVNVPTGFGLEVH